MLCGCVWSRQRRMRTETGNILLGRAAGRKLYTESTILPVNNSPASPRQAPRLKGITNSKSSHDSFWQGIFLPDNSSPSFRSRTYEWLHVSGTDFAETYTGSHTFGDYCLSAEIKPLCGEKHLLNVRVQGRYNDAIIAEICLSRKGAAAAAPTNLRPCYCSLRAHILTTIILILNNSEGF